MMCLKFGKGNNLSRVSSEERKKNDEIERMIRRDKKQQAKNVKILLLGQSCNFLRLKEGKNPADSIFRSR